MPCENSACAACDGHLDGKVIGESVPLTSRCDAYATGRSTQRHKPTCVRVLDFHLYSPEHLPCTKSVGPTAEARFRVERNPHHSCVYPSRQVEPLWRRQAPETAPLNLQPQQHACVDHIRHIHSMHTRLATRCEASGQLPPTDLVKQP